MQKLSSHSSGIGSRFPPITTSACSFWAYISAEV
jgi:hypothetical protein